MQRKRYSRKFQRMAVERMRTCEDVGELAKELGVTRRCLYKWRAKLDLAETAEELARPRTSGQHKTHVDTFPFDRKSAWRAGNNKGTLSAKHHRKPGTETREQAKRINNLACVYGVMDHYHATDHVSVAQLPTKGVRTIYSQGGYLFPGLCILGLCFLSFVTFFPTRIRLP